MSQNRPARFTYFFILAYDESDEEKAFLARMMGSFHEVAYIRHDKDLEDDGVNFKKPHWHFVLRTNQRTAKNLAKCLGTQERFVEGITEPAMALRYLIHKDDPSKHQYPAEAVRGSLKAEFDKAVGCDIAPSEESCVLAIMDMIYENDPMNFVALAHMCAEAGMWEFYRKNYAMIRDVFNEYNRDKREKNLYREKEPLLAPEEKSWAYEATQRKIQEIVSRETERIFSDKKRFLETTEITKE